jgi:hypothetical protein
MAPPIRVAICAGQAGRKGSAVPIHDARGFPFLLVSIAQPKSHFISDASHLRLCRSTGSTLPSGGPENVHRALEMMRTLVPRGMCQDG